MASKIKFGSPAWRKKYNLGGSRKVSHRRKTQRGKPMARRKKSSGGFKRIARKYASKAGFGMSRSPLKLDAMLYGVARPKIADWVTPITNKLPFGAINDEVGMAIALWMGAKYLPSGMMRQVAMKGLDIENYRVGEAIATGQIGIGQTSAGANMLVLG